MTASREGSSPSPPVLSSSREGGAETPTGRSVSSEIPERDSLRSSSYHSDLESGEGPERQQEEEVFHEYEDGEASSSSHSPLSTTADSRSNVTPSSDGGDTAAGGVSSRKSLESPSPSSLTGVFTDFSSPTTSIPPTPPNSLVLSSSSFSTASPSISGGVPHLSSSSLESRTSSNRWSSLGGGGGGEQGGGGVNKETDGGEKTRTKSPSSSLSSSHKRTDVEEDEEDQQKKERSSNRRQNDEPLNEQNEKQHKTDLHHKNAKEDLSASSSTPKRRKRRRRNVTRPPRPRLRDPPPRLDVLPQDLFTPEEREKVARFRSFIDAFPIDPSTPSSTISLPSEETEAPQNAPPSSSPSSSSWLSWNSSSSSSNDASRGGEGDSSSAPGALSSSSSSWLSWGGGGASASGEAKKDEDRTGTSGVRTLQWEEVLWLDDDLLLSRYLRSYNWNEDEARKQLLKTLAWRRERKPQNVSPYDVMKIAEKGSIYRKGFDRHGRAIIYFKPGRDAGTSSKASQEHILYTVERALQSVKRCKGKDQLVFLLDFNGWGLSQLPTTEVSREIVTILNYHYTDVLAHAFIIDAPSFFDAVWRLVCLMVDPETAKKVVFLNSRKPEDLKRLREVVPEEYIERSIGGGGGGGEARERENEEKEKKEEQEDSSSEEEESDEEEEEEEEADEKDDYSHEKYWRAEKSQFVSVILHRKKELERLQKDEALQKRVLNKPVSPTKEGKEG